MCHVLLCHAFFCVCVCDKAHILKEKNGVILTYKIDLRVELKFDPGFRVIG